MKFSWHGRGLDAPAGFGADGHDVAHIEGVSVEEEAQAHQLAMCAHTLAVLFGETDVIVRVSNEDGGLFVGVEPVR
jgi:hypothetical protein